MAFIDGSVRRAFACANDENASLMSGKSGKVRRDGKSAADIILA